ncbi:MAG TPA: ABC transporter ATP-binding protein [Halanaerobiales bacterium]|nr:ABC transporter ATP-binding protein [Halanaerobiales bacterium]
MREDFREEKKIENAYDSELMKRLLGYSKQYWKILLLCIFLLLIVTGVQLARPYIIKIAIDDHINALDTPMVAFDIGESPIEDRGTIFRNKVYIRENRLGGDYESQPRYQIINHDVEHYLIKGTIDKGVTYEVEEKENTATITTENDAVFTGPKLNSQELVDFREQDISALIKLSFLFLGLILTGLVINYIQTYLLRKTSQRIIYNLRQDVFSHLQKMSLAYFDKNPVGRLVTRVTNDTERIKDMYINVLVTVFKDFFLLIGIIAIMFSLNLKLSIITLAMMPLVFLAAFIFRKYVREAYREVRTKLAKINSNLSENISGMKIIQIFNQEKRKLSEFVNINNEYYKAAMKQIKIFAVFRPTMGFLYSLTLAIIIWNGGNQVLEGIIQFGVLYAFIDYIKKFFQPINDLSEKYNILQSAMAASERIFEILDTEVEIKNPDNPVQLPEKIEGKVEFKDVSFAYEEDEWVLKNINLKINPGETVALVGATGAGKSSVIKLISRFYDIQKGKILIDDINIKNINKKELREKIGVVLQDVFLFTGDMKSNIRLNADWIPDKKIIEAAKYVNAHKFISKLPKKYEHKVKERGATLSAGQRQLLAFARALAFDPDILVLDEATSNIDTETEVLIQDALEKLTRDRTTIVIAHRLSTIQDADKIVVMHKGEIREVGDHQELLDKNGIYYDLYQLQYKDQLFKREEKKSS